MAQGCAYFEVIMDTHIVIRKNGKDYNQFGDEVIECEICSNNTTMMSTKLCNRCWNAKGIFNKSEKEMILDSLHILDGGLSVDDNERLKIEKLIKKVKLL